MELVSFALIVHYKWETNRKSVVLANSVLSIKNYFIITIRPMELIVLF